MVVYHIFFRYVFLVLVGLGYKIEDFTHTNKLPDNYWYVFSKHSCPMLHSQSIKNTIFRGANFGAYTDPSFSKDTVTKLSDINLNLYQLIINEHGDTVQYDCDQLNRLGWTYAMAPTDWQ